MIWNSSIQNHQFTAETGDTFCINTFHVNNPLMHIYRIYPSGKYISISTEIHDHERVIKIKKQKLICRSNSVLIWNNVAGFQNKQKLQCASMKLKFFVEMKTINFSSSNLFTFVPSLFMRCVACYRRLELNALLLEIFLLQNATVDLWLKCHFNSEPEKNWRFVSLAHFQN